MSTNPQTPLERVETLFEELAAHYGDGEQAQLRAAAKVLLVGLAKVRDHGGPGWQQLLDEYVDAVKHDPARFARMLESNRATSPDRLLA